MIFHNLRNYDAHLIMQKLGKYKDHRINVIASTLEKYTSFKIKKEGCPVQLVFTDSFQNLSKSLEKLVNNFEESQLSIQKSQFPNHLQFLARKGLYPYNYFSSFEKCEEKELPPPEAFYNTLRDEAVRSEDYQHAQNVWSTFNMKNLGENHDL